jgi:hypothetical protein
MLMVGVGWFISRIGGWRHFTLRNFALSQDSVSVIAIDSAFDPRRPARIE